MVVRTRDRWRLAVTLPRGGSVVGTKPEDIRSWREDLTLGGGGEDLLEDVPMGLGRDGEDDVDEDEDDEPTLPLQLDKVGCDCRGFDAGGGGWRRGARPSAPGPVASRRGILGPPVRPTQSESRVGGPTKQVRRQSSWLRIGKLLRALASAGALV